MTPEELRQLWLELRSAKQQELLHSLTDSNALAVRNAATQLAALHQIVMAAIDTFKMQ